MLSLTSIASSLSHLFFPHICAACGTDIINADASICARCIHELPLTNFHLHAGNPVEKIFWGRAAVTHATSLCYFSKESLIQQLLHQLKYKGNQEVGIQLGKILGTILRSSNRFNDVDLLIPLPLFASKERKRGYNQAAVISDGCAATMKIPVVKNSVLRLSATETQTHKTRIERWQNISEKFSINDCSSLINKHVLLIDDVITTGATLESCAQELLKIEGLRLSIATLAFATTI